MSLNNGHANLNNENIKRMYPQNDYYHEPRKQLPKDTTKKSR